MSSAREDEVVRKMAAMLKSGAAMLEQTCPFCNVPLFRLKTGEVVCPSCGQRFVIVSSDEEEL
ncbi:MAG: Sjogren's syndrome/scleroderma autoantigen 1 family protein, partial [Thermofilaceae archaeon]